MNKEVNEKYRLVDIAKMLNISTASVSRVLNNLPGVKEETRKAVLDLVKQLNYENNRNKKNDCNKKKNSIVGLIINNIRDPFYSNLAYYIQAELFNRSYLTCIGNIEFNPQNEESMLELMTQNNLAALILMSSKIGEELDEELKGIDCPVTLIDRVIEQFEGNAVMQDNFQAGYMATQHLLELGYKEIAFIAGLESSFSSCRRVDGYRQALTNYFLPINEDYIERGESTYERGYNAGIDYCDNLAERPRGIIIASDMTAIGFIEACREKNVKIPEQISIVSFDDIPLASYGSWGLTTVRHALKEMAEIVADLTVKSIEEDHKASRVMMAPTLIVRNTTIPYEQINKTVRREELPKQSYHTYSP